MDNDLIEARQNTEGMGAFYVAQEIRNLTAAIDRQTDRLCETLERAAIGNMAAIMRAEYLREKYKAIPTKASDWAQVSNDDSRAQSLRDAQGLWDATAQQREGGER